MVICSDTSCWGLERVLEESRFCYACSRISSHPPGTSREVIVAGLDNIDQKKKNVYLKRFRKAPQDKVIQELQQQRQQAQQRLEGQASNLS